MVLLLDKPQIGNLSSNYQIYEARKKRLAEIYEGRKSVLQRYADHQALVNISHEDHTSTHHACLIDVWG